MKVIVPENMGGELRILPEETFDATVQDIFLGESVTKNPKMTMKYVLTSEAQDLQEDEPSCIGENVLETYSLQPQAMFRLNGDFKKVTGSNIPHQEYDEEEFLQLMKDTFLGTDWTVALKTETTPNGNERTVIERKELQVRKAKGKGKKAR